MYVRFWGIHFNYCYDIKQKAEYISLSCKLSKSIEINCTCDSVDTPSNSSLCYDLHESALL